MRGDHARQWIEDFLKQFTIELEYTDQEIVVSGDLAFGVECESHSCVGLFKEKRELVTIGSFLAGCRRVALQLD